MWKFVGSYVGARRRRKWRRPALRSAAARSSPTKDGPRAPLTGFGYFAMLGPAGTEAKVLGQLLATRAREVHALAAEIFREESRVVVRYEPKQGEEND